MAGHIPDSASQHWCTPVEEHQFIYETFGGEPKLDPCSNPFSKLAAAKKYMLPEHDGLEEPWEDTNFINPPWGKAWRKSKEGGGFQYIGVPERKKLKELPNWKEESKLWKACGIDKWITRAWAQMYLRTSLLLVPAYVDTAIWQDTVWPEAAGICFPRGRISFEIYDDNGNQLDSEACPTACAYILFAKPGSPITQKFYNVFKERGHVDLTHR